MTEVTPSPFSTGNPKLQLAWDATSLQAVQFCPRYYQMVHLEGWSGVTIDLEFGGYAASGWELYQKSRLAGDNRDTAQLKVLRFLMETTWLGDGRQWGGVYEDQWRCTGTEPYRNAKGNRAKCPYSHKGMWFPQPQPDAGICGHCGSPLEVSRNYMPDHKAKNRQTLCRTLMWYIDEQPEDMSQGLRPYAFPDGRPAVELSFKLPLPYRTPYGENYLLAGHMDYLGQFGTELFIVDNKTTTHSLTQHYWQGYSPHMQMDTYDLVASVMFPDLSIRGVMVDAAQVMANESRFGRHPYYKTETMREEHWKTIEFWIKLAEQFAEAGYWPMNKRNCWLCPFANVCNKPPEQRERFLKADFAKREPWNPLVER